MCKYVGRSAVRDGRQAWLTGTPVPACGPKSLWTTAGTSWSVRGGPQYSAAAVGVLQRNSAPSVSATGQSTPAFGNAQQPPTLVVTSPAGAAAAAAYTKTSTTSGSGGVSTKCQFSSAVMPNSVQHGTAAAAGFNSQIKYAAALVLCYSVS